MDTKRFVAVDVQDIQKELEQQIQQALPQLQGHYPEQSLRIRPISYVVDIVALPSWLPRWGVVNLFAKRVAGFSISVSERCVTMHLPPDCHIPEKKLVDLVLEPYAEDIGFDTRIYLYKV